jgi:hypothetical protein
VSAVRHSSCGNRRRRREPAGGALAGFALVQALCQTLGPNASVYLTAEVAAAKDEIAARLGREFWKRLGPVIGRALAPPKLLGAPGLTAVHLDIRLNRINVVLHAYQHNDYNDLQGGAEPSVSFATACGG